MKNLIIFSVFFFMTIVQSYAQLGVDIGIDAAVPGEPKANMQGGSLRDGGAYHGRKPINTRVRSDIDEDALPEMSAQELSAVLDDIETSLTDCELLGQKIETKMFAARGSGKKIHPDWIEFYGDCLAQRDEDHRDVESEVKSRDDAASLVAKSDDLERSIRVAYDKAQDIERDYNFN